MENQEIIKLITELDLIYNKELDLYNKQMEDFFYPFSLNSSDYTAWRKKTDKYLRHNYEEFDIKEICLLLEKSEINENQYKTIKGNLQFLITVDINGISSNDTMKSNIDKNKIFIVHGQNEEVKLAVERCIIKLGLTPVILHKETSKGKTIIEKFEDNSNVGFAVALLTDDDEGKSRKESNYQLRARQNVILELGYFMGKLGRARVFALKKGDIETPTDILGVIYHNYDEADGKWQLELVKELNALNYNIDANNLL